MRHLNAIVAVVALQGCVASQFPSHTACSSDGDCGSGRDVCALGTCVDPQDQSLTTVSIEIDPSASHLPVQDLLDVDLRHSPRVDVVLKGGVDWTANITHDGAGIQAQLIASPVAFIPGRVIAPTATTDAAGQLSMQVVDGGRYRRTVFPSDTSLPPLYLDGSAPFTAAAGLGGTQDLKDIDIADPPVTVTGVVKAGVDAAAIGIPQLAVVLVDGQGKQISSQATTAADGSFALALPAPDIDLTLQVTPTADNVDYPTFTASGIDATAAVDGVVDLGVIDLGDVKAPVPFSAAVTGSDGAPVAGATAIVTAPIGNGTFSTTLTAGDDGTLSGQLPPGTYDVVAYGPAGVATAGLLTVPSVAVPVAGGGALALHLPERVNDKGRVIDPDGKPLADAALTLVRIPGDNDPPDLAAVVVSFAATSGADGTFSVDVDPGRYRVTTTPQLGSNAPGFSQIENVDDSGLTADIQLPPRAVVAGTVKFGTNAVAGAFVRVFSTGNLVDEQQHAILLGQGATGADGGFELVVPDLLKLKQH